jgi:hypothetical protein
MAGGADEVEAGMHSKVDLFLSLGLLFLKHVRLMLVVKELDNRHPGVTIVDIVAEARRINDGQADCSV